MASSGFNDCNSQLNDSIDKSNSKIHSSEHEETVKVDQMATKKLSNSLDEKVSSSKLPYKILKDNEQIHCHTIAPSTLIVSKDFN